MPRPTRRFIAGACLLYLVTGLLMGIVTAQDNAGEDLMQGNICSTWQACQGRNQLLIAAGALIWPVYIVGNPFLAVVTLGIIGAVWLMQTKT